MVRFSILKHGIILKYPHAEEKEITEQDEGAVINGQW